MNSKKIIVVTGATGQQGGAVVRAILADRSSEFSVRAITRKPDGDPARALAKLGVEVVFGDIDDTKSITKAFSGAYGAFCVTNFFEHGSPEKETAQGRSLAEAAKDSGIQHAVWSTLDDTRKLVPLSDPRMPTLRGKYKTPHYDGKGEADHFFTDAGVPTTLMATTLYWESLINFGIGPKKGPDGKLVWAFPLGADKKCPGFAIEDLGKAVYGIFRRKDLIGKKIGISTDQPTCAEITASFSRAFEQPVTHNFIPHDVYRSLGVPLAEEFGNMWQYVSEFQKEFCSLRDVTLARSLVPDFQTFDQWLMRNKGRFPLG